MFCWVAVALFLKLGLGQSETPSRAMLLDVDVLFLSTN